MFCANCGAKLAEGSAFCHNCGSRCEVQAPAPQPLPQDIPETQCLSPEPQYFYQPPQAPETQYLPPEPQYSYQPPVPQYQPPVQSSIPQPQPPKPKKSGKTVLWIVIGVLVVVVAILAGLLIGSGLNNGRDEDEDDRGRSDYEDREDDADEIRQTQAPAHAPAEDAPPEETAPVPVEQPVFAFVPMSADNPYYQVMMDGFTNLCSEVGAECIISCPESYSIESQVSCIEELMAKGVTGIAVVPIDPNVLEPILQEARDAGIIIVTVDSDAPGADLYINPAGTYEVAYVLVEAIYDLTGGEGQFAVMSSYEADPTLGLWVTTMKEILTDDAKYKDLEWVTTVYDGYEPAEAQAEAENLLATYSNLEVICSLSSVGIGATCNAVEAAGSSVLVTGLGLPSEMEQHIETGVCPYMFLWNPQEMGSTAAYAMNMLYYGFSPEPYNTFTNYNGIDCLIWPAEADVYTYTSHVVLMPYRFDQSNVGEWARVY